MFREPADVRLLWRFLLILAIAFAAIFFMAGRCTAQFSVQFHPSVQLYPAQYQYRPAFVAVFDPRIADPILDQTFTTVSPVRLIVRQALVQHGMPCSRSRAMLYNRFWGVEYEFPLTGFNPSYHRGLNYPLLWPRSYRMEYGGYGWSCGGPKPTAVALLFEVR